MMNYDDKLAMILIDEKNQKLFELNRIPYIDWI